MINFTKKKINNHEVRFKEVFSIETVKEGIKNNWVEVLDFVNPDLQMLSKV